MNILVVMPVNEEHKKKLEKSAPGADFLYTDYGHVSEGDVKNADIIVGNVPPEFVKDSAKLKLLQLNSAGTDGYTEKGVIREGAVLANATGAYGLAISEHMLGMLLCLMKKLDIYKENMKSGKWEDAGMVPSVYGTKTLVVGLGDIGNEFAKRMWALGSRVFGIKRRESDKPDYIEDIYALDRIEEAVKDADIVAACLPGTKETYRLFDKELFAKMKNGAYFINVGRGTAVDTDALTDALLYGKLAGACLDVTDPEPLPSNHPLWSFQNVLITPHVSGGYHMKQTHDRIIDIAVENIGHILKNEPLRNVVDMTTGYKK